MAQISGRHGRNPRKTACHCRTQTANQLAAENDYPGIFEQKSRQRSAKFIKLDKKPGLLSKKNAVESCEYRVKCFCHCTHRINHSLQPACRNADSRFCDKFFVLLQPGPKNKPVA